MALIRRSSRLESLSFGALCSVGGLATLAGSLPLLGPTPAELARLSLLGLVWLAVVTALAKAPSTGISPARSRLSAVVVTMLALAGTGLVSDGLANAFSGLYVLVFVYVGVSCRSGTSLSLLPVAGFAWWVTNQPVTLVSLARLPVAIGIWLVVGELLARLTGRNERMRAQLAAQVGLDPLTGLFNRHGLDERLAAVRPQDCVVFLDLDHFKAVNDVLGHAAGDAVLSDLGRVVLAVLRDGDSAVRYGGEEFLLLLLDCDAAGADTFLERLTLGWMASHPELTFSAGITTVGRSTGHDAVERADMALYEAKRSGRNRWLHAQDADRGAPPGTRTPDPLIKSQLL